MLGMVSGLISDSQITASNQGDRNWMPENVRLVTSRSGWVLPPAPHPYVNEWLQVDLGEEKIVRGIIIQGGKHRENKVSMRKFKIGYSNNGSDWKVIMDDSKRKAKVRSRDREQRDCQEEALPHALDWAQGPPAFSWGSKTSYFLSSLRSVIPNSRADRIWVQKVMSEINMKKNCIAGHFSFPQSQQIAAYRLETGRPWGWASGTWQQPLSRNLKSLSRF